MPEETRTPNHLFEIASNLEDACVDLRSCIGLLNRTIESVDLADKEKMSQTVDDIIYLMRGLGVIHKDFEAITQMAHSASRAEKTAQG